MARHYAEISLRHNTIDNPEDNLVGSLAEKYFNPHLIGLLLEKAIAHTIPLEGHEPPLRPIY
jgi:hypothetical protein